MIKRAAWFIIAIGLSLSGCQSIEQCTKGENGCLEGQAVAGKCLFDLVPNAAGICVEPGDSPDAGAQECNCEAPAVCAPNTNECINYCEAPDIVPGSVPVPPFIDCDGEPGTFESICRLSCRLHCRYRDAYCGEGAACPADHCDSAEVLQACQDSCGGESDPASCLREGCHNLQEAECGDIVCPGDVEADCRGVTCTNDCPYLADGDCDDGDLASAKYGVCEWGSDCADCGPRRGPAPALQPYGEPCVGGLNCVGFEVLASGEPNLARNEAWCLPVTGPPDELTGETEELARCVPDCSRTESCPDGYGCIPVTFEGETVKQGEYTSRGCVPMTCDPSN